MPLRSPCRGWSPSSRVVALVATLLLATGGAAVGERGDAPSRSPELPLDLTDEELLAAALAAAEGAGEVIEVVGEAPADATPARRTLDAEELAGVPGTGGDPLRALQTLPGFARAPLGLGAVIVRGVSPRDSAVLVDGVRVPLAFHFLGVTSFLPSTMLERVDAYPSAAIAPYGRTLGAVIDVRLRRARGDQWRTRGELGLLHAAADAEGPAGDGAVLVGVRRSWIDAALAAASVDDVPRPSYVDAQLRYDRGDVLDDAGASSVIALGSLDRVAGDTDASLGFARVIASWERLRGATRVRVAPWIGIDDAGASSDEAAAEQDDLVEVSRRTWSLGGRVEVSRAHPRGEWSAGLDLDAGRHGPTRARRLEWIDRDGTRLYRDVDVARRWVVDAGAWIESLVVLGDGRYAVRPGLRLDRFDRRGEWALDPRLTASVRVTPELTLRSSAAIQSQPVSAADVDWGEAVEPHWADVDPELRAMRARHLAVGAELSLGDALELSATAYRIDGERLPVAPPVGPDRDNNWSSMTEDLGPALDELLAGQLGTFELVESAGRIRNRGVELDARYRADDLTARIAYTWSRARRDYVYPGRDAALGPYVLDQPHVVDASVSRRVGSWGLGARARAASGVPTLVVDEQGRFAFTRVAPFVALDLRVERTWRRAWGTVAAFVDVQNATNRRNQEGPRTRGLPILPLAGVEVNLTR